MQASSLSFFGSLHWPADAGDMSHFGISCLLLSEEVTRPHVRAYCLVSISSVPVSEGIEIGQGCRFIGSLVRVLGKLPGGLVGAHHARLVSYVQVASSWLGSVFSWLDF